MSEQLLYLGSELPHTKLINSCVSENYATFYILNNTGVSVRLQCKCALDLLYKNELITTHYKVRCKGVCTYAPASMSAQSSNFIQWGNVKVVWTLCVCV